MSGTAYRSNPILPFGTVACTFFPTTFLEIAVSWKRSGIITSCQDFYLGEQKGYTVEQLPNFFFWLRVEIINVLYILEALRHNNIMPGLLPRWTRKEKKQPPIFFFRLRIEMLNVLCILEALRHKYHHARTSTWVNQKRYRTTPYFFFFSATDWNAKLVM